MLPAQRPRIKICCIGSLEEARLAVAYGASALGLVSEMPGGPGVIPEELITRIAARVPPAVSTFLLTSHQDAGAIIAQQRACRTSTIQLCDRLPLDDVRRLRAALPGIALVQVVHITGAEAVEEAVKVTPQVHGLLLDSGNRSLPVKELGGTGRTHDWDISRRIREAVDVPVFLAGGLNPKNVRDAIDTVSPFGVDVCSGVRSSGALDETKLAAFFRQVAGAELAD